MPGLDGYAATRKIMAPTPTPIVMISSVVDPRDTNVILSALGAGALSIAEAPPPPTDPSYRLRCAALAQLLRSMAAVRRPIRRAPRDPAAPRAACRPCGRARSAPSASRPPPAAQRHVRRAQRAPLRTMPPILVVQHLSSGFAPELRLLARRAHRP